MKLFLFAIGGTGERVLRSFTMLLASGVKTFDNYEVYPIVIDYDQENGDKTRTVELLKNYAAAHNSAFTRHAANHDLDGQANQFFASALKNLSGLDDYVFPFKPAQSNEKFRNFIGFDEFSGDLLGTESFLTSLYDKSDRPDTELNLNMTVGFKGNPNIGSVVFHTIGKTKQFANFKSVFNPNAGDKVMVIGSLFGGTGASGIPEIIKTIEDVCNKNHMRESMNIGTIQVLPYFAPLQQHDSTGAIKSSRFNSKTKAALHFYDASGLNNLIDRRYYVGDFFPTVIPYNEGGTKQVNNANFVEFIAAMMIEHFVSGRGGNKKEFKFSINANVVVSPGDKTGDRLYYDDFDLVSKESVMDDYVKLSIALKFFHEKIWSGEDKSKDYFQILKLDKAINKGKFDELQGEPLQQYCSALDSFYNEYQRWMKELDFEGNGDEKPANSHRLALCDMERPFDHILIKDIPSVSVTEKPEKSTMDKIKDFVESKSKSSSAFEFDPRMNFHLKDEGDGKGHYDTSKNDIREGHEPEWVLADLLHLTASDALVELKKSK